jgi:long-chain acyl-CoA synthetase
VQVEDLIHDEKVNSLVLKQLQDTGRKGNLKGIEIIEGVVLADDEWTPQNVSSLLSVISVFISDFAK